MSGDEVLREIAAVGSDTTKPTREGWAVALAENARQAAPRTEPLGDDSTRLRDLVSRLGFGDNLTEPMADNDTIVAWFEERTREADEWRESQRWRDECYEAGHPGDEDCAEHDPTLRSAAAEGAVARVWAVCATWDDEPSLPPAAYNLVDDIRAALDGQATT